MTTEKHTITVTEALHAVLDEVMRSGDSTGFHGRLSVDTCNQAGAALRGTAVNNHDALVAALAWALPYAEDAKITLTQRVRDEHAKALYNAQAALTTARALMLEK